MTADWPVSRPDPVGLNAEWYRHLAGRELRFQRCGACGAWRHPPRLLCASCGAEDWTWERSSGRGRIFSWTVSHRPLHWGFADVVPYAIVVAELDEGVRLVANVRELPEDGLALELPLEVAIQPVDDDLALPYFVLRAGNQRRPADVEPAG